MEPEIPGEAAAASHPVNLAVTEELVEPGPEMDAPTSACPKDRATFRLRGTTKD